MAKADKTAAAAPGTAAAPVAPAEAIKAPDAAPAAPEAPVADSNAGDTALDGLTAAEAAALMKNACLPVPGALAVLAKAEAAPAHAQEHAAAVNLGQRLAELKHAIEAEAAHLTAEASDAVRALYSLL